MNKLSENVTLGEVRAYCASREVCPGECKYESICPAKRYGMPEFWDLLNAPHPEKSSFAAFDHWIRLAKIFYDMGAQYITQMEDGSAVFSVTECPHASQVGSVVTDKVGLFLPVGFSFCFKGTWGLSDGD